MNIPSSWGEAPPIDPSLVPWLVAAGLAVVVLFVGWVTSWRFSGQGAKLPRLVGRTLTAKPPLDYGPILQRDPGFSEPLLLDLCQLVFTTAHGHRPHGLEGLRPYLAEPVRQELARRPGPVEAVAPGACRVVEVQVSDRARIVVEHLAYWRHRLPGEPPVRIRAVERWTWERDLDARSPSPAAMQALRCPACGSADPPDRVGRCASCDTPRCDGSTQWRCVHVHSELRRALVEELVLGTRRDIGRDLPTVRQPHVLTGIEQLPRLLPDFTWGDFVEQAEAAFLETHAGWATAARHHHTDRFHQVQRFLASDMAARGLRPVHERVKVERIEPAKVVSDAWYVALTVRIFSELVEYVVDDQGHVVSGNAHQGHEASEYWTFLKARPTEGGVQHCPSCGASLNAVPASRRCTFCESQLSGAPSGWLVSATVDDDVYVG